MKNSVESVENAAEKKGTPEHQGYGFDLGDRRRFFAGVHHRYDSAFQGVWHGAGHLITCVYATLGGECGVMGWIKTTKDRNRERKWEQEDKQEAKAEAAELPPGDMPGA